MGISDEEYASISVLPNPNNGLFTVSISSTENNNYEISVINTIGSTILESDSYDFSNNSETKIDLRNAPSGIYFVVIRNASTSVVKKIIIENK